MPVVVMVILLSRGISGSRGALRIVIDLELVIPIIINIKELQPYHIISYILRYLATIIIRSKP